DLLEVRDRLAAGVDEEEAIKLAERMAMYAEAAELRCEKLRDQLKSAEDMATMLRREASRRPRPSSPRP
ncbi:MAG: hypothetical protein WD178_08910, partial [Actinomycetota bacterium]